MSWRFMDATKEKKGKVKFIWGRVKLPRDAWIPNAYHIYVQISIFLSFVS